MINYMLSLFAKKISFLLSTTPLKYFSHHVPCETAIPSKLSSKLQVYVAYNTSILMLKGSNALSIVINNCLVLCLIVLDYPLKNLWAKKYRSYINNVVQVGTSYIRKSIIIYIFSCGITRRNYIQIIFLFKSF